jgi:ubiquitin C-terminal hydrolase
LETIGEELQVYSDTPIRIPYLLQKVGKLLGVSPFQPHDAHEVLLLILLNIHEDTSQRILQLKDPQMNLFYRDHDWKRSVITDLCCGQERKQIVCRHCKTINQNFETFLVFHVDPKPTLVESVKEVLKPVQIEGWVCDHCHRKENTTQTSEFCLLPYFLFIGIRRFHQDSSGRFKKDNQHVSIPNKINIHGICYSLRAFICHFGDLDTGHYICYRKVKGIWVLFDDDRVYANTKIPIDEHGNIILEPYIILYEKYVGETTVLNC